MPRSRTLRGTHAAEGCQYLDRRRRCSEAAQKKAQFRSYHPGEFVGQQDLGGRHSHACLGRWSAHCWTSPPRPQPNVLDLCVLWVHGVRHGTDGRYCVLYSEYKVVPLRVKMVSRYISLDCDQRWAAGFVGDLKGWRGSDRRGTSYRIAGHMLSHTAKRPPLAKCFVQRRSPSWYEIDTLKRQISKDCCKVCPHAHDVE